MLEVENGNEPSDFNTVNQLIADTWESVFTTNAEFFDPTYKSVVCQKILKHYLNREIGAETVGLFKLWVNTKMEEILPYYNQLWESALLDFNPLLDIDITTERNGEVNGTENSNGSDRMTGTDTRNTNELTQSTGEIDNNNTTYDKYSDTPQGTLGNMQNTQTTGDQNIENNMWLTNARIVTDDGTTESSNNSTFAGQNEMTYNHTNAKSNATASNTTEEWFSRTYGKNGGISYSRYLKEFRETFLNIDLMFIEEFEDCFMQLW